ncbi:hypothetical protein [Nitrosopumilus sp.]|uniref:hypothetical protein n=1 Tax=Nitrosopumilus sp. TaxID=2024843 RepID=UPI00261BBE6E|nr:hypothetical protein [Nitrosopumilus sp.]
MHVEWKGPMIHKEKNSEEKPVTYSEEKGVYIIANTLGQTNQIARYVGKGDIAERINAHKRDNKKCMQEATDENRHIYYALVPDETMRSNIEHTLYYGYGGDKGKLCNDKDTPPKGEKIQINYPPKVHSP